MTRSHSAVGNTVGENAGDSWGQSQIHVGDKIPQSSGKPVREKVGDTVGDTVGDKATSMS